MGTSEPSTQELGQRVFEAKFAYMTMLSEMDDASKESKREEIICKSLQEEMQASERSEPLKCYRSTGKGFLLHDATDVLRDLEAEGKKLAAEADNFKKGSIMMKRTMEAANQTLVEHLRRRQRAPQQAQ